MIEIRRYNASKHQAVLEFLPDRTPVHIGPDCMSTLRDRNAFTDLFLPDGVWLAVADGAVAGALLVGPYDDAGSPCVSVYGIKVDEPYRRQGIGSMLMQKADESAQSVGIDRLFLETSPDNNPELSLFNKYGYEVFLSSPGSENPENSGHNNVLHPIAESRTSSDPPRRLFTDVCAHPACAEGNHGRDHGSPIPAQQ